MANIRFGIQFVSEGVGRTIAELLAVRDASIKIADQAPAVAQLANSLSTTGSSANKLAADLGKSPAELNQVISSLKSMQAAGVSTEQQILSLAAKFGITAQEAKRLQEALAGEGLRRSSEATIAAANAQTQLAGTLGLTRRNAGEYARELGLTAQQTIQATQRMGELDRSGATTATKFKLLNQEFGLTRSGFESLNASFNSQTRAQEQLAKALGSSIGEAKKFATETGLSASKSAEAIARYRELSSVGATLAEKQRILTQEVGLTNQQFDRVRGATLGSAEGMAGLTAAATGVAAALGSIGQKGIQAFVEFDDKMRTFGVISEASAKQTGLVRDEVERLGITTQKTPKEVATLSIELAKAGFKAGQVKDALGGIVLASQATGDDLQRTGEVIGNVINQFAAGQDKFKATDSTKIADLLVATSNASASGVNDIGEALSYVGTQAAQSGQSLKDTLQSIGQLANAGIKGSSAGTGLAEALRRLKLASANASTELDDLKSKGAKSSVAAFKQINDSVRDATGQLLPLPVILEKLKSGLSNVGQADKDLIMNSLFGVQGGRVVQSLLTGSTEQINGLKTALDNSSGAAKRAGDALSQGPAAALKRLESSLNLALVKVGEFLSQAFLPLVSSGELLINTFNSLPGPMQGFLVATGAITAGLASAVAMVVAYNAAKGLSIVQDTLAAAASIQESASRVGALVVTQTAVIAERAMALAKTTVTAGQIANTIATTAGAAATGIATIARNLFTAATVANTGVLIANAGAAIVAVAPFLAIAAALGAIAVAVGFAQERLKAFEPAGNINKGTEELKKFQAEAAKDTQLKIDVAKANEDLKGINEVLTIFQQKIAEQGLIAGSFAAIDAILTKLAGSTEKYGEEGQFLNQTQLQSQAIMEALEAQLAVTNGTYDKGTELIAKYGLMQFDSTSKTKLGAEGIAKFNAEARLQVDQLEKSVEVLKKSAEQTTDKEQKAIIEGNIKSLESQKDAIQKRSAVLLGSSEALKTDADRTKDSTTSNKKLEDSIKSLSQTQKDIEAGTITEADALEKLEAIRTKAANTAIGLTKKELEVERKATAEKVAELQKQAKGKEELAAKDFANPAIRTKAADEQKLILGEIEKVQADFKTKEKAASEKAEQDKLSAGAGTEIVKIKKDQNDAELAQLSAGEAAVSALLAAGKITEEEAERQLTAFKAEEIGKRIALKRLEAGSATGESDKKKLNAEADKLESELAKNQAESGKKIASAAKKDREEALSVDIEQNKAAVAAIEASRAEGNLSEGEAERQLTVLKLEEIKKRIAAKKAEAAAETDPKKAAKLQAEASQLESSLRKEEADSKKKIRAAEKADRQKDLDVELAAISAQQSEIEAARATGRITEAEAEQQLTALKIQELLKRVAAAQAAAAAESDPKLRSKELSEARKLTAEIEKIKAESVQRIFDLQIKKLEEQGAKAIALAKISEQERSNAIQQGLNSQSTTIEQAATDRLTAQKGTLDSELAAAQAAANAIASATATTQKQREELDKRKLDAAQKVASIQGNILGNEAAQQNEFRNQEIEGINSEQAARTRAIEQQIQEMKGVQVGREIALSTVELGAQREVAAIDKATNALKRQNELLAAKAGLAKAQNDAALAGTEIQIQRLNAAQQRESDPQKKIVLQQQENDLQTKLEIQKRAALITEQAIANTRLDAEQRSQNFAASRTLIEARINELKAKQAVLTAQIAQQEAALTSQKALQEAAAKINAADALAPGLAKDKAIADALAAQQSAQLGAEQSRQQAQQGIAIAQQGQALATQGVAEATANKAQLLETNALQKQTLTLEQKTALTRFDATEQLRQQNVLLDLQKQKQEAIAAAVSKSSGASTAPASALPGKRHGGDVEEGRAYVVGEDEPEIFIPGVSGTILNQQQIVANLDRLLMVRNLVSPGSGAIVMPLLVTSGTNDLAPLLAEIKALRSAVLERPPVIAASATFVSPDDGNYDKFLALQRSIARGSF